MKSYQLEIVFDDLQFDHVPLEYITYDAASEALALRAETEDGKTKELIFRNITSISMSSNDIYDMNIFCVNDFFHVTLFRVLNTTDGAHTFLFPTESSVWEIKSLNYPVLS